MTMQRMRRAIFIAQLGVALLAQGGGASAATGDAPGPLPLYAGASVGSGRMDSRIVDVDGFSNWGNPGWAVNYDDLGSLGGFLAGRKFQIGGARLRIELEGAVGNLSASSDQLDPQGLDETAQSELRWMAAIRAGIERSVGSATLFAAAGLAIAGIDNSVTDLDRSGLNDPWHLDPDDSFDERSRPIGWTVGLGFEAPLSRAWLLRLEASHLDFGRRSHRVNLSANGHCGPGNPRRPCVYEVEERLAILRLAAIRRF